MAEDLSAPSIVTTMQLARLLLLSERRIFQLLRAGILRHAVDEDTGRELKGRFRFVACLHAYLKYQRNELGADDVIELKYLENRGRRMAALAEAEEMRLAQLKGTMHRSADIEFVLTNIFTAIRNILLAVPSRCARLLLGKTNILEVTAILEREVEFALNELVAINADMFKAENDAYLASLSPNGTKPSSNGGLTTRPKSDSD
jgi:phage terminase Nu1 subunit (DNA packaging protein)